jgi:hypothetical protein
MLIYNMKFILISCSWSISHYLMRTIYFLFDIKFVTHLCHHNYTNLFLFLETFITSI